MWTVVMRGIDKNIFTIDVFWTEMDTLDIDLSKVFISYVDRGNFTGKFFLFDIGLI